MVNIWKIGAWPAFPGKTYSLRNKNIFINEYALPNNYVAVGWADCTIEECENRSRRDCKSCRQHNEFLNFTKYIKEKDIILLYNYYNVYVGEVIYPYYEVDDIPNHRIDVKWKFNKNPKKVDFSLWQDTVHQVLEKDIPKIKSKKLIKYLMQKGFGTKVVLPNKIRKDLNRSTIRRKYGSGGEGEDHKELKEYIASNPDSISLKNVIEREIEYEFPSRDRVDVLFKHSKKHFTVVEIETNDPWPGAYQAIKYKALKCVELGLPIQSSNVKAVLVAWEIPSDLRTFCKKYNIKFKEVVL